MVELITALSRSSEVDRKIIDRATLTGTFDIELTSVPSQSETIVANPADVVSIFTAVQEQLGLKLESRREPLDVVVIDAVERPEPN
jgi:uncharacterized protein (TIGR03435 family)